MVSQIFGVILLGCVCTLKITSALDQVTLNIDNAKLVGNADFTSSENGRKYYSFLGLRFTEAPVREKRWTDPKLLELSPGEDYNATSFGSDCIQWIPTGAVGSEDCLFLNVYTPNMKKNERSELSPKVLVPVMFYVHAGGFSVGSGSSVGPKFLLKHDVVLVTFNYRLGALGFLSTGHKNLPGNYGMLDQVVALDWVKKYVHNFGGDPNSITVFGHSAGAGSTHLLTMSPLTLGKFQKAIIQSGTALGAWSVAKPSTIEAYAAAFVNRLGCRYKLSDPLLVTCLKNVPTIDLLNAQKEMLTFWLIPVVFNPVVDKAIRGNAFLTDYPENIMKNGLYHRIPVMGGVVQNEGLIMYAAFQLTVGNKFGNDSEFLHVLLPRMVNSILPYGKDHHIPRIVHEILMKYFPENERPTLETRIERVSLMFHDAYFGQNTEMFQMYGNNKINTAYSYIFTHRKPKSPTSIWSEIKQIRALGIDSKLLDTEIGHVDDMYYLFDPCTLFPRDPNHVYTEEDKKFVEFITAIWVAFANNGNPNDGLKTIEGMDFWNPVKAGSVNYFNLTTTPASMGSNYRAEYTEFWRQIFNSLDQPINTDDEL